MERYANGGAPTWSLARPGVLPARGHVRELVEQLITASDDRESLLVTVVGLGGEGKTTAARQVAAALVEEHGWTVLSTLGRPELRAEWLDQLPSSTEATLLLVDNADLMLEELSVVAGRLPSSRLGRLHVLGTSRSQDWSRAIGLWLKTGRRHPFRHGTLNAHEVEIQSFDLSLATGIEAAWREYGIDLGVLRGATGSGEIASRLVEQAQGLNRPSLFASLLSARLSPQMLLDHAAAILSGLAIHGDDGPVLARSLAFLAMVEVAGFGGMRPEVLADLIGLSDRDIWRRVLTQLGEECGLGVDGNAVRTRHEKIAAALVHCVRRPQLAASIGVDDLGHAYADIVRQTILTNVRTFIGPTFGPTVHCGAFLATRLRHVLGDVLDVGHANHIAITAAKAALDHQNRADAVVDYCEALIAAGRVAEAIGQFRQHWNQLPDREDFTESARGFLFAWAVAEGQEAPARSLWLALLSLCDQPLDVPIAVVRKRDEPLYGAKTSLSGVGRALQLMTTAGNASWRVQGLAAAFSLGHPISPDENTRSHFERHLREATALGLATIPSKQDSLRILAIVGDEAYCRVGDRFLESLAKPPLTFEMLAACLNVTAE